MDATISLKQIKAVGVIPARWASTRFPGKPLAKLQNKPLMQHVWERARLSRCLCDLIIATDDERIQRCAQGFGATAVMTSQDHPSGTDRIVEVLQQREDNAAYVVNIQGDEPLLNPLTIDRVVTALHKAEDCVAATAAVVVSDRRVAENPNRVKVVMDQKHRALYFSRSLIPYDRKPPDDPKQMGYYIHIGLYAYRCSFLLHEWPRLPGGDLERRESLEQLRLLESGYKMAVTLVDEMSCGVDTPDDLAAIEQRLSKNFVEGQNF